MSVFSRKRVNGNGPPSLAYTIKYIRRNCRNYGRKAPGPVVIHRQVHKAAYLYLFPEPGNARCEGRMSHEGRSRAASGGAALPLPRAPAPGFTYDTAQWQNNGKIHQSAAIGKRAELWLNSRRTQTSQQVKSLGVRPGWGHYSAGAWNPLPSCLPAFRKAKDSRSHVRNHGPSTAMQSSVNLSVAPPGIFHAAKPLVP